MKRTLSSGIVLVILMALVVIVVGARAEGGSFLTFIPFVTRFGAWVEVGEGSASGNGISGNPEYDVFPSIDISTDGTPYVAWTNGGGLDEGDIFVRSWDGSNWVQVGTGSATGGGITNNNGSASDPSIGVAPNGKVYVAWATLSPMSAIYVRFWDGGGWDEVGAGSASGNGISDSNDYARRPDLAIAPNGNPYVTWQDGDGDDLEIYVRTWNGSSWVQVGAGSATGGGISNNNAVSWYPSIAVAPNGTPYVAWVDYSSQSYQVYARVWNGSSWAEIGAGSASGGGLSDAPGSGEYPDMGVAPDGTPYIAWQHSHPGGADIYVLKWNGSDWVEVGAGSASGGGISNTGIGLYPSLAFSPNGTPVVAWVNGTDIYVRTWNGSSWVEMGFNSASGGGINNSLYFADNPSIAVDADGTPYVAWEDYSNGFGDIYVRRFIH